jgi:3-oxoacyl-[acyl-carrier-protein] synthase-3
MTRAAYITATGRYHPEWVVPNSYFYEELGLDTNEEWIRSRTGVIERRRVTESDTTASMSTEACRRCLEQAGLQPEDIDGIIVATITGDLIFPSTACRVQAQLGARRAWAWDVSAACSGYVFGLAQARALIGAGMAQRILVIGAETMSAILDYTDRETCIIFGDGAGATLVEACEAPRGARVVDVVMHSDGNGEPMLWQRAGGSATPPSHETIDARQHFVQQQGRPVFKAAVTRICEVIHEVLERNDVALDEVAWVVPHQANIRIIEACYRRLKMPADRVIITVAQWANTTAATIPTSLDFALREGKVQPGDKVVLATFGAGFTWGSVLLQY